MLERFLQMRLLAKILPPLLLFYLLAGFAGTTSISFGSGRDLLCERSFDYGGFAGAIIALIGAASLWRSANNPSTVREQHSVGPHKLFAGILVVLAVALVIDGIATKTSTSSPKECQEIDDTLSSPSDDFGPSPSSFP